MQVTLFLFTSHEIYISYPSITVSVSTINTEMISGPGYRVQYFPITQDYPNQEGHTQNASVVILNMNLNSQGSSIIHTAYPQESL